jgi:polar amino acid transport system substrate-binding protein
MRFKTLKKARDFESYFKTDLARSDLLLRLYKKFSNRVVWSSLFLFCIAAPVSAETSLPAECQPNMVAEKYPSLAGKTLTIGVDPTYPPYVMRAEDDFEKIIGIDADLARAVFDCAGVDYEFFVGGWSGLLPALMAGQIDVMWVNLYYKPERAKKVDFIIYMQAGTGGMAKPEKSSKINDITDLCGFTVGAPLGSVELEASKEQEKACSEANEDPLTIITFPMISDGVRLLNSGRSDIMLTDLAFVNQMVSKNPSEYSLAFKLLTGFNIGAGVANGNDELRAAIYENLKIIQDSGSQEEIFAKYNVDKDLILPAEVLTD